MDVGCYSETKKLPNGRHIRSNALDAGGHLWRIAYYPNGRLAGAADYVALFVQLDDAGAVGGDVHVELRFVLHEVGGGGGAPRFVSAKVAGDVSRRRSMFGFERLVSQEYLEKSVLLRQDRFTIRCELTVLTPAATLGLGGKPAVETPPSDISLPEPSIGRTPPPSAPPESEPYVHWAASPPESRSPPPSAPPESPGMRALAGLPADLGHLLATREGADVVFEVSGKAFDAHKLVLAARSPVFKADFFGPMKEEASSYIRICDMHPDAFEALLQFIYTDSLPETMMNASIEKAVLAQDLLVAAGRYDLKDLKLVTEKRLCNHVGVNTVLPMLALAEHQQCRRLKKKCLDFIASGENTRAVMATDDVEHLARNCPNVVNEMFTRIVDAREATPGNPLIISVDPSFYFYALLFIVPLWALLCVLLLR